MAKRKAQPEGLSFDELFIPTDAAPDALPTSTPGDVAIQSWKVHKESFYV
jgi:hypothetical protein